MSGPMADAYRHLTNGIEFNEEERAAIGAAASSAGEAVASAQATSQAFDDTQAAQGRMDNDLGRIETATASMVDQAEKLVASIGGVITEAVEAIRVADSVVAAAEATIAPAAATEGQASMLGGQIATARVKAEQAAGSYALATDGDPTPIASAHEQQVAELTNGPTDQLLLS